MADNVDLEEDPVDEIRELAEEVDLEEELVGGV